MTVLGTGMHHAAARGGRRALPAIALAAALAVVAADAAAGTSGPGRQRFREGYFPNLELTTHEGKKVKFYDDVIKDKVVAINFMFTSCKDVCPGETARLRQVQQLLGDRVGDDVFMYSITIDPDTDTPEVLADYHARYKLGPGWTFLTGKDEDLDLLQRKLGLLIEDLEDPNDHNVNLIIGNEATTQWMTRSPYDNPSILAGLLADTLHNWKVSRLGKHRPKYEDAAMLPTFTRGEYLFETRCSACHSLGAGDGVGPDLHNVTELRERPWLERWLKEPDAMIAEGDPTALEILEKYDGVRMPNLRLQELEIRSILDFLAKASADLDRKRETTTAKADPHAAHRKAADPHAAHRAPASDPHAAHRAQAADPHAEHGKAADPHAAHRAQAADPHAEHRAQGSDPHAGHAGH